MLKPIGVMLVLVGVAVLVILLVPLGWGILRSIRAQAHRRTALLGATALGIFFLSAGTLYALAPKRAQTLARQELPDGQAFVLRSYRNGWFDYPALRFYARDVSGEWRAFQLISELGNAASISLVMDPSKQEIAIPGVGWYRMADHEFVNPDGSRASQTSLPEGIAPDEEDLR